jgi:hypothetical protein
MNDLDHRLGVLIHKLRLDSQTGRMILIDDLLQEEKLLLETRVLPFQFMDIIGAKLKDLDLLSDGLEQGVTHEQRSRVYS